MNDADKAFMARMLVVGLQLLIAAVVGSMRLVRFALAPEASSTLRTFAKTTMLVSVACLLAGAVAELLSAQHASEVISHLTAAAIIVHLVGSAGLLLRDLRKQGDR